VSRIFLFGSLQYTASTAYARSGGAGVGDGQLFLGVIALIVVGFIIAKVPTETLKAIGGFILLASLVIFAINVLSSAF